jgi:hypothetical protein
MKILQIKHTTIYDIFLGEGWKNWSRYRFVKGIYTHLEGTRLSRHIIEEVKEILK